MTSILVKHESDDTALEHARQLLTEALAKLAHNEPPEDRRLQGRLIFCLDLTASRQGGLDQAQIATAAMFDATKKTGRKLAVKFVYFRGKDECKESQWCDDPDILRRSMLSLSCKTGETQIGRSLRLVLRQTEKPNAVVFVGDQCEEDSFELSELAQELGRRFIPLFVFHDCNDEDERCLNAKPVFKRLALCSGGVYVEFNCESGDVLLELLSNVAAYSAGGTEGIRQLALPKTSEARQLQERLLLGSGSRLP
jgi:hypothetical protein